MKRYPTSLVIREINADQNHVRFHFIPIGIAVVKKTGKKCWGGYEVTGTLILCLLSGLEDGALTLESSWQFLKSLDVELPYAPTLPHLGISPRELK